MTGARPRHPGPLALSPPARSPARFSPKLLRRGRSSRAAHTRFPSAPLAPALPGGGCTRVSPCRLIPRSPPGLPSRAGPLFETRPLRGLNRLGSGGRRRPCWGTRPPPPRPPALGVGQEQTRSRGTTVARARLGARGGGARAPALRGGASRVRPARERACGLRMPGR